MSISTVLANVFGGMFAGYAVGLCSLRLIAIFQQQGYAGSVFFRWYYRRQNTERKKASLLALSLALLTALFCVCFSFLGEKWANLISILPFAGVCILYCTAEHRRGIKVPLRATRRATRLVGCHFALLMALAVGLAFGFTALSMWADTRWVYLLRYVPLAILPFFFPLVLALANLIMQVYEVPRVRGLIRHAEEALAASPAVKVGITGSFGKTSVKHFAAAILAHKYQVVATPASYNTPLGIARTVNELGTEGDIFLAEMGARHTGDIAELCAIVRPAVGVVTGVCAQHVKTFGSLEAIRAEKGVLASYVKTCILGRSVADMDGGNALVMGRDFDAEDVQLSLEGTRFTLRLREERIPVEVPVLGRHAAEDIALAAALCSALGMKAEEIAAGIHTIKPVAHRLERKDAGGVVILDDGYNCNEEGAKNAVEVLRLSTGKKFAVTPGIVELGQLEEEVNAALGASLVGLDRVILVGETLVLSVRSGYLAAGGAEEKLTVVPSLSRAQALLAEELSAGDCVLFLNDLPDMYEK